MKKRSNNSSLKQNLIIISMILYFSILLYMFFETPNSNNLSEGFVTNIPLNVSIRIYDTGYQPSINIVIPINRTYNYRNITINYSLPTQEFPIDKIWYNADLSGNTKLTANTTIYLGEGNHALVFYANNSLGNWYNTTVYFTINTSFRYNISYAKYSGNTTDFNSINTKIGFENITNLTLERPSFGKMVFLENINISQDDTNLDAYTNIMPNYAVVNSSYLPFLNKSAIISLYELNFTDVKLMSEGTECLPPKCNKISYINGTLIFNVSHFSNSYYALDNSTTQAAPPGPSSSGGSSGGTGYTININLDLLALDRKIINVTLKQNENKREYLTLINNFNKDIDVEIDLNELQDFITFSNGLDYTTINIKNNRTKTLQLIFSASTSTPPGIYFKNILITTNGITKKIPVIINLQSKDPLFDVIIKIIPQGGRILLNRKLLSEITITNIKSVSADPLDANVKYKIYNSNGSLVYSDEETRGFERQITYVKQIELLYDLSPGIYEYYVSAEYENIIASSTSVFEISKDSLSNYPKQIFDFLTIFFIFIYIFIVVLSIIIIIYLKYLHTERGLLIKTTKKTWKKRKI